jgi:ubiquinone biosynthesis protein
MDDLRTGRLTVRTQDDDGSRVLDRLGRRVFAGLVVGAFVISGAWLVPKGEIPQLVGIVLIGFGLAWMFWHVVLDLRRR